MKLEKIVEAGVGLFLLSPFEGDITITTVVGAYLLADAFNVKLDKILD